jgi:hypothetical protein
MWAAWHAREQYLWDTAANKAALLTQHIVDSRLGLANIGHAQRSQFATQFTAILALANHSLRMLAEFGFQLV